MKIEYAKLTPTPAFIRKENKSDFYIHQNSLLFLNLYHEEIQKAESEKKINESEYLKNLDAFEKKECRYCGGEIRYIENYNFWGCSNYRDAGKIHSSFTGKNPDIWNRCVSIDINWVSNIIKKSGYSSKVRAKDLFNYYTDNGLQDLREIYGKTSAGKRINGLSAASVRSKEQELKCLNYLQKKYSNVVYQQCITYKEEGKKESFCIPDFICSDKNSVYIIDAKLDYVNDDKMDRYIELIKFILISFNDDRLVYGAHIFYEGDECINSRHPILTIKKSFQ